MRVILSASGFIGIGRTPVCEAAQALYAGHDVSDISRSDAGAINLSRTAYCISQIIEGSKASNKKSICFVTGVPGSGKTLAGLNLENERLKSHEDEHAVFLSGNGPLVTVLREALARDEVERAKDNPALQFLSKKNALTKASTFIQNIHHFRDENLCAIAEKVCGKAVRIHELPELEVGGGGHVTA